MAAITPDQFLDKFRDLLEDTDPATVTLETKFRDLDEWSSMTALSLIAMADEDFDAKLTGNDIRSSNTVSDIYNMVNSKLA